MDDAIRDGPTICVGHTTALDAIIGCAVMLCDGDAVRSGDARRAPSGSPERQPSVAVPCPGDARQRGESARNEE